MSPIVCRQCLAPIQHGMPTCPQCGRVLQWGAPQEYHPPGIQWRQGLIWTVLLVGALYLLWRVSVP